MEGEDWDEQQHRQGSASWGSTQLHCMFSSGFPRDSSEETLEQHPALLAQELLLSQITLALFSLVVFWVLTTKDMANEFKLKELFPGEEESCCSQSPPAEAAGGAMKPITNYHWGHFCASQRALATTNSGSALPFLCRNVPESMASVKSCFPMQSPQIFPWFLVLASNLSEFSQTLVTLQITQGESSNLPLDISPFLHIPVTFGRERNWAQIFQDYTWDSPLG